MLYHAGESQHTQNTQIRAEDGGKVGGSGANFPLSTGRTPSQPSEEQSEQPTESQLI